MKLRVVNVVTPAFGAVFSGITHRIFSLLSGWSETDISIDLYGTRLKPENIHSGERLYRLPAQSIWVNSKKETRKDRLFWSIKLLFILIIKCNQYDIVHFHTLNWGVLVSPLILHLLGKKIVFTMSQFGNDNPSYISQQSRGHLALFLLRKFDGFIGISPALVDDAKKHDLQNVVYLPNFMAFSELEFETTCEMKTFARDKLHIPQNAKVLLFVGSIIPRKGVDVLVDAFIKLGKKHANLHLILVGPQNIEEVSSINEVYVSQQKQKINQARLNDQVVWVGLIRDQNVLVDYYRSADMFVFPTRNEGLGNVLIEATVAGLPVVATHLPGITDEVVYNNESGYLVEPDSPDKFANAIEKILLDNLQGQMMGALGRKKNLGKFGFDFYCHKLRAFYLGFCD